MHYLVYVRGQAHFLAELLSDPGHLFKDANKVAKTGVSLLQTAMTGDVATDEADEIRVQDMLSEHRYDDDGSSVQTASDSSSTDDEVNDLRVEQMLGHVVGQFIVYVWKWLGNIDANN